MDFKTVDLLNIIQVSIIILYLGYLVVLWLIDRKKKIKLPVAIILLFLPLYLCFFTIRYMDTVKQKELLKQLDGQEAVRIEKDALYVMDGNKEVRILTGRLPEFVYVSSGTIHAKDGVLYIGEGENQ